MIKRTSHLLCDQSALDTSLHCHGWICISSYRRRVQRVGHSAGERMSKLLKLGLALGAAVVLAVPVFAGGTGYPAKVPEPSTLAMLASGIGAIAALRSLRKRN